MRLGLIAGVLAMVSAIPAAAIALDGTYGLDCSAEISDMRVTVEGDRIKFWETRCRLTNPVNIRDMEGAVLYDAVCTGEGVDWTERMLLMPSMDGGLIRLGRGVAVTYDRCD